MTIDPTRLKQLAVSDNGFVFDPYTGHTFTLNATGITVLEGLKRGDSSEQIVAALTAGFDLAPAFTGESPGWSQPRAAGRGAGQQSA